MLKLRRILPRGLFGRSLLIVLVPLVLLQLVSAYFFYSRHWEDVGRRLVLGLAGEISLLIDAIEKQEEPQIPPWLIHRARYDLAIDANFRRGASLSATPPHALFGPLDWTLARVLPERLSQPFQFDTRADPERVTVAVEVADGLLTIITPRKRLFSTTIYVFILWMVGTSLVLLAIAVYFLLRQVRPMRSLAAAAESFGKGILVVDFKPSGATEVRQAARAFLLMRERIRRQMIQRTEMLAGVSHDLRTPLTRMKLQLEMGLDADAVAALKADVADMERMTEGYLAFARGEGSEIAVAVDVAELLDEVADDARRNGAAITVERTPAGVAPVLRRDAIKRALTNLVDNAARYGSRVALAAEAVNGAVDITIDDDGPGIPEDQRKAVFKAFYRLDASRNLETGGVGLGLTIAGDVVRGHGGDIILGESPAGGLRATVRLPV